MKIQEGPAFGAFIIGSGVGYLLYQKTQNLALAAFVGAAITLVDYFILSAVARWKEGRK